MGKALERVKDGFHDVIDGVSGCLGDLLGEVILGLAACGVLAFIWWAYRAAPYVTVPVVAGVLVFAGLGAFAFLRGVRGTRLGRTLAGVAVLTAGVVVLLVAYLPQCGCLD